MISSDEEFAQRLRNKLIEAIKEADLQLALGYADTFENYKDRVGFRRGLLQALDTIPQVMKEMGS